MHELCRITPRQTISRVKPKNAQSWLGQMSLIIIIVNIQFNSATCLNILRCYCYTLQILRLFQLGLKKKAKRKENGKLLVCRWNTGHAWCLEQAEKTLGMWCTLVQCWEKIKNSDNNTKELLTTVSRADRNMFCLFTCTSTTSFKDTPRSR